MTAEVPPGPARKAGIGIVTLARMSGRPIIPVAAATSRFLVRGVALLPQTPQRFVEVIH
jgi:lysophospholipid acyltransferase (LPLAT)-like uncharacterized protein